MERERPVHRPSQPTGGDPDAPAGDSLEQARARLTGLSDALDRALDGLQPVDAELALQQNRQSGGQ